VPFTVKTFGAAEVAKMLGVRRQRVSQLTAEPDFAEPWLRLRIGKVWLASDIRG